jgi:integrase/recombinase XerD
MEEYRAFSKRKGFTGQTQESYVQHLKSFFAFVDRYYPRIESPAAVNKRIVSDYHDYLCERKTADGKPLANKSICAMLFAVKSFYSFLTGQDLIATDPTKGLILPKQERRLVRDVLTEAEVITILKSCNTNTPFGLRDRAILELVYSTGIRTSELCNLKVADVDLKEQTVFIDKGKGNISRLVPAGQYAIMYAEKYLQNGRRFFLKMKVQDPGYLFLTQFGNPFDRKSINQWVMRPIQQKLKLKKNITVYSFRHALATHLLQHNVDVSYIARLLGHRSLNTTQQYLKIEIGDLKRVHGLYHPRG